MGMNPTWAVYWMVSPCSVIWCCVAIGCGGVVDRLHLFAGVVEAIEVVGCAGGAAPALREGFHARAATRMRRCKI